jgi:integral membrane protein
MTSAAPDGRLKAYVIGYRVMAYITGVLIIVICFAGLPLQFAAGKPWIDQVLGTVHGYLYIGYVIIAWLLGMKLRLRPRQLIPLLLAGIVPVMTFVVERWMTRTYIAPALAGSGDPVPPQQPVSR